MKLTLVLNDEQWLKLLEQVAKSFSEVTLNRGFTYFKQQSVASLKMVESRVIQAKVTGSEEYDVTLYLDQIRSSLCSCPVHFHCKHMVAALMELAYRSGYPASQIVNAQHHVKRIQAIASAESLIKELPNMDVQGWHDYLNQTTSHIKQMYDLEMYMGALRAELARGSEKFISSSEMDKAYFELHQELFIVHKLRELNAQNGVSYYTPAALYRSYDRVEAWIQHRSNLFSFTHSKDRLEQTLSYVRQQMAGDQGHKYMDFRLYTALLEYWILPDPEADHWILQELANIEQQLIDCGSASLSASKAFLYLNQAKSEQAWSVLQEMSNLEKAPGSVFLTFLNHLNNKRAWGYLVDWLLKTAPYFYGSRTNILETYLSYWREALLHDPEAEKQMWSVLEGMLPLSALVIEDMLYEQRKWKLWIEIQIWKKQDPLSHRVSVLQPIEKESPIYLLPYYHQAIEYYVSLKNRRDYKLAVKLLKRLEKVYKKMKRVEQWDLFFTGFTERYSRLRALQEEMKKGKLLQ